MQSPTELLLYTTRRCDLRKMGDMGKNEHLHCIFFTGCRVRARGEWPSPCAIPFTKRSEIWSVTQCSLAATGCSAHSHICEEKGCGELSQKRRVEGPASRCGRRRAHQRRSLSKISGVLLPAGPRRPPGAPGGQRESPLPCDLTGPTLWTPWHMVQENGSAPSPGHVVVWASPRRRRQGLPRAQRVPSRSSPGKGGSGPR